MRKTILHTLWGALFILCACLGFIQERNSLLQGILTCLGFVFFIPPAALLYGAYREKDRKEAFLLRNLSILSLGLTLVGLILAIATAPRGSAGLMNVLLTVVSVPMYCTSAWALSLLLWACLLIAAMEAGKKTRPQEKE